MPAALTADLTPVFDPGPTSIDRAVYAACMPDPEDYPALASISGVGRAGLNEGIARSFVRRHVRGDFGEVGILEIDAPCPVDESTPLNVRNTAAILATRGEVVSRYTHRPPGDAEPVTIEVVTTWHLDGYFVGRDAHSIARPATTVRLA